jgi:hypothetical protein
MHRHCDGYDQFSLMMISRRKHYCCMFSRQSAAQRRALEAGLTDQQPRHMFFIAASVRAFSALSGSADFPGSDAGGVLDVAVLPGALGGDILS